MSSVDILVALLLFIALPILIIWVFVMRYGRRHQWGIQQYVVAMVVVGVGWWVVFDTLILKTPLVSVAKLAIVILPLAVLYALGLVAWDRFAHRYRRHKES
ncbi:MAG: hypothetical protein QN169_04355 [Armatimonadota bacterium]|nr:hypothetical protein [Armatimonadota bacterium]